MIIGFFILNYISYKRLKRAFPDKNINLLFDYSGADDLTKAIEESDISYIFPRQLQYINNNFFDTSIAINCLHEMNSKNLNYYFNNIDRLSKYFYFTIWTEIYLKFSNSAKKQYGRENLKLSRYLRLNLTYYAFSRCEKKHKVM